MHQAMPCRRRPEIAGAQQSEAQIRRDADGQGDDDRRAASPQTPRVRADREVAHGAGDGDGEHHRQQHVGDARRNRAVQQQGTQPLRRVGQRRHEIVQHRDAGFPQPDDDERPRGETPATIQAPGHDEHHRGRQQGTQDRPRHGHPQQIELEEAVGAGHAGKAGGELAVIG